MYCALLTLPAQIASARWAPFARRQRSLETRPGATKAPVSWKAASAAGVPGSSRARGWVRRGRGLAAGVWGVRCHFRPWRLITALSSGSTGAWPVSVNVGSLMAPGWRRQERCCEECDHAIVEAAAQQAARFPSLSFQSMGLPMAILRYRKFGEGKCAREC